VADASFEVGSAAVHVPAADVRLLAKLVHARTLGRASEIAGAILGGQLDLAALSFREVERLRLTERQLQLLLDALEEAQLARSFTVSQSLVEFARAIRDRPA
jgi:hypothetical protein